MALHSPRVWWAAIALLLWTQSANCRNVTNEDIRDALISLVHSLRILEDKQDRHEYRQKLRIDGFERKLKTLDSLKGMITNLGVRLSNVELLLRKCDINGTNIKVEAETNTREVLDGVEKTPQTLTSTVTQALETTNSTEIDKTIITRIDIMTKRLEQTDAKIDAVKIQIDDFNKSLSENTFRATCLDLPSVKNPFEKHISKAEKLLNKYEQKLNEYNVNFTNAQIDSASLADMSLADEAWHNNMTGVLGHQEEDIKKIQQLLLDAESMWKDLPRRADLRLATNQTLDAIVNATEYIKENDEKWEDKLTTKLREISDRLDTINTEIQNILTKGNRSERTYNDIFNPYDSLRTEIQMLLKSPHILPDIADYAISIKKMVEYGVHQILTEVGELIKVQNRNNITIYKRFDSIEATIASNQTASVGNLTAKIESEISQVWRQIGVMFQQLTINKGALDALTVARLTNHTLGSVYNMSYALGQLSLAPRERLGKCLQALMSSDDVTATAPATTSITSTIPSFRFKLRFIETEEKKVEGEQ